MPPIIVPEPATIKLVALGMLFMIILRAIKKWKATKTPPCE
jgi:hypothetical protein